MNGRIGAIAATLWLGAAAAAFAQTAPAAPPGAAAVAPASAQAPDAGLAALAREQAQRQREQPGNNAPVWREVRSGASFYTTAQGPEAGVLIEPGGRDWQLLRPKLLAVAGALVAGMLLATVAFYFWRGPLGSAGGNRGRMIERFSIVDRVAHWTMGGAFVVLAVTGLIMSFGKWVLLPLMGHVLFGWIAAVAKNLHNFAGPVLALTLPVFFVVYVRDNFLKAHDVTWLLKSGGMFDRSGKEIPSGRFNFGEKGMFWGMVVAAGVTLVASGFVMLFPNFEQTRALMRLANIVHLCAAGVGVAFAIGHIYMGTFGMRGAYDAMRTGLVDEAWAREHHELWYEDVKAGRARQRFVDPADRAEAPPVSAIPGNAS